MIGRLLCRLGRHRDFLGVDVHRDANAIPTEVVVAAVCARKRCRRLEVWREPTPPQRGERG